MGAIAGPKTLQEAVLYFANLDNCREYLAAHRWPNGVTCPRCGSTEVLLQAKYNRWQCGSKHQLRQFTFKTGTIFEDSPLGIDKWLLAMWQVVNCKNGASSYEVHRAIGVTQKTAWVIDHRIRLALGIATSDTMAGEVLATPPTPPGMEIEFKALAEQWRKKTRHTSSLSKMIADSSYRRIMGMGRPVLPILFAELREHPDHWLVALNAITGQDPAPPGSTFSEAVDAWLAWGRAEGYLQ